MAVSNEEDGRTGPTSYQSRAAHWMDECFGSEWRRDPQERLYRFVEEAIELAQAGRCSREEIHLLIDYVFKKPPDEITEEVGGVMVTLAGFCEASGISLETAAENELRRNYTRIDAIREKRRNRSGDSPLPT